MGHDLRKPAAVNELLRGVRAAALPCQAFTDGVTIQVGDNDDEPGAVPRYGPPISNDASAIPDPLVIVEVLSASTSATERGYKLREYFRVPSLRHCLIVWPDTPRVVHHRLTPAGAFTTEVFTEGEIALDPPGISLRVASLYMD